MLLSWVSIRHKMNARDLAKIPITDLTFSVVDVETTGMNAQHNRIMDIGIITIKNGEILEEWEALINPQQEIPYWITYYTKLGTHHVKDKPFFSVYAQKVFDKLSGTIFVGHNAGFDYGFVSYEFKRAGLNFYSPKLCTVLLGRKLLPQLANAHLDALSDYYGITISARHRALPDAQATAYILNKFLEIAKEKYGAKTFFDLERLQKIKIDKSIAVNEYEDFRLRLI